jgi:hypothetical protein
MQPDNSTGNIPGVDIELGDDPEQDKITVGELPMFAALARKPNVLLEFFGLWLLKKLGYHDAFKLKWNVHAKLWNPLTGEVKYEENTHNLVVTTGKVWLAKKLNEESVTAMSHVAIGTSNQSPAAGDTGLVGTEAGRVSVTRQRTSNAVLFPASFPPGTGTNSNINEAGIFDGSSGTTMLARVVTASAINKTASDQLDINWTITVG